MSAAPFPVYSRALPIVDQLNAAANEKAAAGLLVHVPLAIMITHGGAMAQACGARGFADCVTYIENVQTACHVIRKADDRFAGDLGTGRVALALQAAGVQLGRAMDARYPDTAEPPYLDVGTAR